MLETDRMFSRAEARLNMRRARSASGPLEGINNKIGAMQRRAYGYRNYEHLQEKLLTLHHTKFMRQG